MEVVIMEGEGSCLRILLACARPMVGENSTPMNVVQPGEEIDAVKKGLKEISRSIQIMVHGAASLQEINKILLNTEPKFDVLHFIGHGSEQGALYFESDRGRARSVMSENLRKLVEGRVKLLVTMACHSENAVDSLFSDADDPAVPAAVCIKGEYPIKVWAAELFSGALYSGLSQGKTLKQSFEDAVGVVRIDDRVGEEARPDTDEKPTPWRRFMLKGDGDLCFPDVPSGKVEIQELIEKSPHKKISRTDELFVGRNAEIADIAGLLEPRRLGLNEQKARIITLCGEGGIGKTRLAQAAAEWQADRGKFPGGIFEAACDGETNARGLALAILKSLDVAEQPEKLPEPEKTLIKFLRGREERTLLVLDNLDEIFVSKTEKGKAGKLLKECITASPCLNILATCRWELNLGLDERPFPVAPMIPRDTIELFVRCIIDPGILSEVLRMIEDRSLKKVIELTAGMPLCVILTARRLRRHGENLETVLKKTADNMLEIMNDPELDHLPKKLRSLRASLDLSYKHLSESEQRLFARMSFFPGGLSRKHDDMWELLGDNWEDEAEKITQYALARYDRSEERYTMLNPVMEYAKEKLDEGEDDEFRRKTSEYWADFARWHNLMLDIRKIAQRTGQQEAAELDLLGDSAEQQKQREDLHEQSFSMLAMEEDNLVDTAEWAMKENEETGLGIVDSLEDYLRLSAGWHTKERLYNFALELRRQLAKANPGEYLSDVAMTLNNMGNLHWNMGRLDEALKEYEEALEIYLKLSQTHPEAYFHLATVLNNIGNVLADIGRLDEALKEYEEALEIYRELSQTHPEAYMPNDSASVFL